MDSDSEQASRETGVERNPRPGWGGLLREQSLKEGPVLSDLKGGDGYMPGSQPHEGQCPGSPSLGLAWLPAMGMQGRGLNHALLFLSEFQSAAQASTMQPFKVYSVMRGKVHGAAQDRKAGHTVVDTV